jgi:hypothetical protein
MSAEVLARTAGQSRELPSGVYNRQAWRPSAVRATESLVAGIIHRAGLMQHAAQLSAWYEQCTRRVQPWPGWFPLSLEFPAETLPSDERMRATPALRLTTLQAMRTATETTPQRETGAATVLALAPGNRLLWRSLPSASIPMLQPRLVTSVSPTPRQEVRGGFPSPQPPLAGLPQAEQTSTVSAPLAQQTVTHTPSSSAPAQQAMVVSGALPEAPGALATLIERTILPGPLPGLELRLLSPTQPASAIHHPLDAADPHQPAEEDQPTAGIAVPTMPVPAMPIPTSSPVPQLDINAIADKVYQTLQRRQQFERERRGLY